MKTLIALLLLAVPASAETIAITNATIYQRADKKLDNATIRARQALGTGLISLLPNMEIKVTRRTVFETRRIGARWWTVNSSEGAAERLIQPDTGEKRYFTTMRASAIQPRESVATT